MATITCIASGNWSNAAIWSPAPPADGDSVNLQNYAVRLDADIDQPNTQIWTTGSGYVYHDASSTRTVAMRADAGNHSMSSNALVRNTSAGTLAWNGVVTGGSGSSSYGANNTGSGVLSVTTAAGGTGSNSYGANNGSNGTLNVTTATGGTGAGSHGAYNNGAGVLNVTTATGGAGSSSHGAYNNASGTLICDLAIGSNWGVGGTGAYTHGVYGSGAAGQVTKVKRIQSGAYGCVPVGGAVLIASDASNSAQFRTAYGGSTLTLLDATASADFPAPADVRAGVNYDNGDKVGTCAVPNANDVAYGVPVDNTTGTAVLTAAAVSAAVWDAARSDHDTNGTFGDTAEWAGSVNEGAIASAVRTELSTELGRIDATVSSRLAPATAGRTLAVAATGEASANVTYWAGDAVGGAPALESTTQAILEDTGTTLPTLIAGIAQTVNSTTDCTTTSYISRRRGDSWSIPLTVGSVSGYTSLWFTLKQSKDDLDSAALVQIKLNASTTDDGLLVVNGAAASDDTKGGITVLDATTGSISIALDETITDDLAPGNGYYYDVQALISGAVTTPDSGTFDITADVTRSVA